MSQMTAWTAHGRFDSVSGRFTLTLSHSHAHRVNLNIYNNIGDFVRDVRQFFLNKKTKERGVKGVLTPLEVWVIGRGILPSHGSQRIKTEVIYDLEIKRKPAQKMKP